MTEPSTPADRSLFLALVDGSDPEPISRTGRTMIFWLLLSAVAAAASLEHSMLQRKQQLILIFALSAPHVPDACADGPYQNAVMSSSPAAYWRFEETDGPVLNSAGTTAPAGTVSGSHQRNLPSANASLGSCIEFSGGGVRVPFSAWTQPSANFSVELWAKATTVTSPAHLAGSARDLSVGSFKFVVYGNAPVYRIGAERGGTTSSNGADATAENVDSVFLQGWHHYVYVHNGTAGTATFHVDGVQVGFKSFSMSNFATNTSDFMIAFHDVPGFPYPFRGRIDEVAFYQRALSAVEIQSHYCAADIVSDTCCPTDINRDGIVNGSDISVLLGFWGPTGTAFPAADINQDGIVNGGDLAALLSTWGPCSP